MYTNLLSLCRDAIRRASAQLMLNVAILNTRYSNTRKKGRRKKKKKSHFEHCVNIYHSLLCFWKQIFGILFLLGKNGFVFICMYICFRQVRLLPQQHGVVRGIQNLTWDCHFLKSSIALTDFWDVTWMQFCFCLKVMRNTMLLLPMGAFRSTTGRAWFAWDCPESCLCGRFSNGCLCSGAVLPTSCCSWRARGPTDQIFLSTFFSVGKLILEKLERD